MGYSLGIFTLPILCDILIKEYGLSGQFLIMGGLMLNGFVFSLLFRSHREGVIEIVDKDISSSPKEEKCDKNLTTPELSRPEHNNVQGENIDHKQNGFLFKDIDRVYSGSHSNISHKSLEIIVETSNIPNGVARKTELENGYVQQEQEEETCCNNSPFALLLKNPLFVMFCFLTFCHHAGLGIFYTFIKAFALTKGVENHRATMLVSMSGLAEMCGNLVLPFISDLPLIRNHKFPIYLGMCFGSGIMFTLFVVCSSYGGLLSLVFVTVFMTSQLHTLRIPFAISMTGVSKTNVVSTLIGLITFCMGTGQGIGPMIGGRFTF